MNKYLSVAFLAFSAFLSSCSSVKSDAKDAATLVAESLEYTRDGNLKKAEQCYKEYREIEAKYKNTDNYEAFVKAYNEYYREKTITSKK